MNDPPRKGDGYRKDGERSKAALSNTAPTSSLSNLLNFKIIDSTLPEGEQSATVYFDTAQEITIVKALDGIGAENVRIVCPWPLK